MRPTVLALLAAALLAGCLAAPPSPDAAVQQALAACRSGPTQEHVLYLGPGNRLLPDLPAAGSAPGNGFRGTFLDDAALKGWLSEPVDAGLWLVGNVSVSFWARSTGSPNPLVTSGSAYRFFDQFGSDRSLGPGYATEHGDAVEAPGTVSHYDESIALPAGGFVVERGDRVRLLLTDLTLDGPGPGSGGHDILFGGATPSQVRFTARCYPGFAWSGGPVLDTTVLLPANQGGLSHAVPTTPGANRASFEAPVPAGTQRLTVRLVQQGDNNPAKDDVDVTLLGADGATWSVGSPYADEAGTLWQDNLAPFAGHLTVQVDSYSGVDYTGRLTVEAETARLP